MNFVSVEELQKYTNVFSDNKEMQELYINSAIEIVESFLGYKLALTTYNSVLNGNGANEIQLKSKPIQSIIKVIIDGLNIPINNFETNNEYLIYTDLFPLRNKNVRIIYEAGYTVKKPIDINDDILDGGNADTDYGNDLDGGGALLIERDTRLPEIIKSTILRIAALLQTESDNNIGITSKSFGDSGSRSFMNYTNFDKYLTPISCYRLIRI